MTDAEALAHHVAVGELVPGSCNAWMDAADRRCGKPATHPYLCDRHVKVAMVRAKKAADKAARNAERIRAWREKNLPKMRAELDCIEDQIRRLDPPPTSPLDHGALNTPLRKRIPSDSTIALLAELHRRREYLRRMVGAA